MHASSVLPHAYSMYEASLHKCEDSMCEASLHQHEDPLSLRMKTMDTFEHGHSLCPSTTVHDELIIVHEWMHTWTLECYHLLCIPLVLPFVTPWTNLWYDCWCLQIVECVHTSANNLKSLIDIYLYLQRFRYLVNGLCFKKFINGKVYIYFGKKIYFPNFVHIYCSQANVYI